MTKLATLILSLALVGLVVPQAHSAGAEYKEKDSPLAPYQELIGEEKYEQAVKELEVALEEDPENADILNLLAFSHRKQGHFEVALDYYQRALKIEPEHRRANEYLGELYLQMGQLGKAEERLQVLDDECFFGCDEFDQLEEAIAKYKEQNPS